MSKNSEKLLPIKYNPNYYVVTANDLIKGKQKMSLREAQLLYITMSQVVKEDRDFKTYTTSVSELAAFMGIEPDSLYRDLEDICTSLLQRVVKIQVGEGKSPKDKKWKAFQWISYAEYANGKLSIRLHDEMKPYLIDLVSHYSQILLGTLCSFKSYYTARLYQLIVCEIGEHPNKPKETWSFTCDELRDFFQVSPNTHKRVYDLLKNTIKKAVTELNASDLAYIWDYEEIRGTGPGRPVERVTFKAMIFDTAEKKKWYMEHGSFMPEPEKRVDNKSLTFALSNEKQEKN